MSPRSVGARFVDAGFISAPSGEAEVAVGDGRPAFPPVRSAGTSATCARRARGPGFTLIEVLVVLALLGILTAIVAGRWHHDRSLVSAFDAASNAGRALDLASAVLEGEVRRSGFRPPVAGLPGWSGPALTVTPGANGQRGDALRVRYLDDRLAGAPVLRDRTFDVAVDGRGAPQLYQAAAGAPRQPVVEGIASLRVVAYIDATGSHPMAGAAGATVTPWALRLELAAEGGETPPRRFVVPLPSRPALSVAPP